jgi:hypothetical protein
MWVSVFALIIALAHPSDYFWRVIRPKQVRRRRHIAGGRRIAVKSLCYRRCKSFVSPWRVVPFRSEVLPQKLGDIDQAVAELTRHRVDCVLFKRESDPAPDFL